MILKKIQIKEIEEFSKKRGEPKWLEEYRKKNAKFFNGKPFEKNLDKKVIELNELLKKPQSKEPVLQKELEKNGLKFLSWKSALKEIPEKLKKVLQKEHAPKNGFEAFINAWFNTGFVLVIGQELKEEKIVFDSVFDGGQIGKILVIVENNRKEIKVLEKIKGKEKILLNETICIEKNSKTVFLRVHENNQKSRGLLFQQTILEKNATLLNFNAWLEGNLIHSNIFNNLIGQGSKVTHHDFVLSNKKQFFHLNNMVIHSATDSESFTEIKSVIAGNSKNFFDGMIKILSSGQRTNAMLKAHSMLLSEGANSKNIPGLEIEADEVKATHSASSAQIADEQLFYLESRGIKKRIAKQLIVIGFLESMIFKLPKDFQEGLFLLVQQKMNQISKDEKHA